MTTLNATFPDTYIVGAPKAGTTSLANWLSQRDEVHVCVPKEPFYWAFDYPRLSEHYGFADRDTYLGLFDHDDADASRRTVDASTVYLYSDRAVPEILRARPDARFVVCLRNPVDLVISYHRTQVVALNEPESSFDRAWRRSVTGVGDSGDPLDDKLLDYPRVGRLGAALRCISELVPESQLHPVVFDDVAANPADVWRQLTSFLDLPADPAPTFRAHNTSEKMFRSRAVRHLLHRPPPVLAEPVRRARQWARESDNVVVTRAKRLLWRREERPSVDAGLRSELKEFFREDVRALSTLIDRDLSRWSQ